MIQNLIRRHLRDFPAPKKTPSTQILSLPGSWWQRRKVKGQPAVFISVRLIMVCLWTRSDPDGPLKRRVVILFTNRTDLRAKEIADVYLQRWNIETFFRDAKQTLGFEECHAISKEHITAYVNMVFLAETILRLFDHEIQRQTGNHFGQLTLLRYFFWVLARLSASATISPPMLTLAVRTPLIQQIIKSFWPHTLPLRWWLLPASA